MHKSQTEYKVTFLTEYIFQVVMMEMEVETSLSFLFNPWILLTASTGVLKQQVGIKIFT